MAAVEQESQMDQDLAHFIKQLSRVAGAALLPVVFTAFVSIPATLGHHPGESAALANAGAERHMT
jgi:hypothetical protein